MTQPARLAALHYWQPARLAALQDWLRYIYDGSQQDWLPYKTGCPTRLAALRDWVRYILMDTRTKIVSCDEAARIAAAGATVVSGYFDPLLASHAERLQELKRDGRPLLVLIAEAENAILPARARAELVAGLRVVDYVCESPDGITAHARLEEEHSGTLEDLIERVHQRARTSSPLTQRTTQPGAAGSHTEVEATGPTRGAVR